MSAFIHFQGFPLLNFLSRTTSESLWRCTEPDTWEALARMIDGASTNRHQDELHANPSPSLPQVQFSKALKIFLKRRIYHLFSELTECLRFYFACSAYLDWVTDFILPKEVFEQSQVLIMHRSNHAGDPGTVHLLSLNRHHQ